MDSRFLSSFMAFFLFLVFIVASIREMVWHYPTELSANSGNASTQAIGRLIFVEYLLAFEVLSLVLLVAMVGAIFLAKKEVTE
ncbi:MAG: NADH-quinone oxidoreductase subunit J [bacterium]